MYVNMFTYFTLRATASRNGLVLYGDGAFLKTISCDPAAGSPPSCTLTHVAPSLFCSAAAPVHSASSRRRLASGLPSFPFAAARKRGAFFRCVQPNGRRSLLLGVASGPLACVATVWRFAAGFAPETRILDLHSSLVVATNTNLRLETVGEASEKWDKIRFRTARGEGRPTRRRARARERAEP